MKNKPLKHYKKVLLPVMLALLTLPGCVQTVWNHAAGRSKNMKKTL